MLKDTPPDKLLAAIRVIAAGDALLSPGVIRQLISADFHAANRASALAELEAEATVLPPGDGGVGAQVGLAQDG